MFWDAMHMYAYVTFDFILNRKKLVHLLSVFLVKHQQTVTTLRSYLKRWMDIEIKMDLIDKQRARDVK